jgi:metal-sulfur cluster biosynthetic enzyme
MSEEIRNLDEDIVGVLKSIYDPEIPVNIYDLGLIYERIIDGRNVKIIMTLTSPNCPVSDVLVYQIESRIKLLPEIDEVSVDIIFEPPWDKEMITEEGQLKLGLL